MPGDNRTPSRQSRRQSRRRNAEEEEEEDEDDSSDPLDTLVLLIQQLTNRPLNLRTALVLCMVFFFVKRLWSDPMVSTSIHDKYAKQVQMMEELQHVKQLRAHQLLLQQQGQQGQGQQHQPSTYQIPQAASTGASILREMTSSKLSSPQLRSSDTITSATAAVKPPITRLDVKFRPPAWSEVEGIADYIPSFSKVKACSAMTTCFDIDQSAASDPLGHLLACDGEYDTFELTNREEFVKKLLYQLRYQRRQLCDVEHKAIQSFYQKHLIGDHVFSKEANPFYSKYVLLAGILSSSNVLARQQGLWLEFGVAAGMSLGITGFAMDQKKASSKVQVFGFDSFEGLPADVTIVNADKTVKILMQKGTYTQQGIPPKVSGSSVAMVKGLFADMLPLFTKQFAVIQEQVTTSGIFGMFSTKTKQMMQNNNHVIIGVNLDCSLYASTKESLDAIFPNLRVGSILHFQELLAENKDNDPLPVLQALVDFLAQHALSLELIPVAGSLDAASFIVREIGRGGATVSPTLAPVLPVGLRNINRGEGPDEGEEEKDDDGSKR